MQALFCAEGEERAGRASVSGAVSPPREGGLGSCRQHLDERSWQFQALPSQRKPEAHPTELLSFLQTPMLPLPPPVPLASSTEDRG